MFTSFWLTLACAWVSLIFFSRPRFVLCLVFKSRRCANNMECIYLKLLVFSCHNRSVPLHYTCPFLSIFTDRRKTLHISLSLPNMAWFWSTNFTCYFPGISFWSAPKGSPLPWCWAISDSLQVTLQRKSKTSLPLTMLLKSNNKLIIIIFFIIIIK